MTRCVNRVGVGKGVRIGFLGRTLRTLVIMAVSLAPVSGTKRPITARDALAVSRDVQSYPCFLIGACQYNLKLYQYTRNWAARVGA